MIQPQTSHAGKSPILHRCTLQEIVGLLPDLEPLEATISKVDDLPSAELFLCALGFEPRCLSVPEKLKEEDVQVHRCLYFEYSTNTSDNDVNRVPLDSLLNSISPGQVTSMEVDDVPFGGRLREIIKTLSVLKPQLPRIWVDASVMSDRVLLRVLKIILEFEVDLTVLYAEAEIYHPVQSEFAAEPEKWCADETLTLEEGVGDVVPSEEHPGYHTDLAPDCVIIFPSFKKDRAHAVLSHVDPSLLSLPGPNVIWLLGKPHLAEDQWRLDAMSSINKLKDEPFIKSNKYEVSTFDYKDALRKLEDVYSERRGICRFTLSMMGSKMQALGTALFCYLHPDVKVVFVTPKRYNASRYSDGCKALWCAQFGSTTTLKDILDKVGTLEVNYGDSQ